MDNLKEVEIIEALDKAWGTFVYKAKDGEFGDLEIKQANNLIEVLKTVDSEILSNREFLRLSWHLPLFMNYQMERVPKENFVEYLDIWAEIQTELNRIYGSP